MNEESKIILYRSERGLARRSSIQVVGCFEIRSRIEIIDRVTQRKSSGIRIPTIYKFGNLAFLLIVRSGRPGVILPLKNLPGDYLRCNECVVKKQTEECK